MIRIEVTPEENKEAVVLLAHQGTKQVGRYRLHIQHFNESNEAVVWGYMHSEKSGKGIPKLLIDEAQKVLKTMAETRNQTVIHQVMISKDAGNDLKLSRYFLKHKYIMGLNSTMEIEYNKAFKPKEIEER